MELDEEEERPDQISDHHEENNNKNKKNDKPAEQDDDTIRVAKAMRAEMEWIRKVENADSAEAIHNIVTEMGVDDMTPNLVNYIIETASREFVCTNCNSIPREEKTWLYNHGTGTYCCPNEIVNHVNGSTGSEFHTLYDIVAPSTIFLFLTIHLLFSISHDSLHFYIFHLLNSS
jgi:hypothetical protein